MLTQLCFEFLFLRINGPQPAGCGPGTISWPDPLFCEAAYSALTGAFLQNVMAGHKVVGTDLPHFRDHVGADLRAVFAAGMELAALRRIHRAGDIAFQNLWLLAASSSVVGMAFSSASV